jgi:hypothetical protein
MGSGSTGIAALRTNRHFIGYDTDTSYVEMAQARIEEERKRLRRTGTSFEVLLPSILPASDDEDFQARASREGQRAKELARLLLANVGFSQIQESVKLSELGVELNFVATDEKKNDWAFDVSGAFTTNRAGLKRTDTLWKALGKAAVLHASKRAMHMVLLTTDAPRKGSAGHRALAAMRANGAITDVIELRDPDGQEQLRRYAQYGPDAG